MFINGESSGIDEVFRKDDSKSVRDQSTVPNCNVIELRATLQSALERIEQNPGPVQNSCGICCKLVKRNDKAIQCDECDLWIHTRCASVDNTTYAKLQNTTDQWFCQNCVASCGICSGNIHNCDPAIECDRCKTWIHNSCAIVSNDKYKNMDLPFM
ncbi:unnamed protein product [Mytilus coruscus]|uniref:PHD-type domain-containing protein n=1 Tax=Mytilus coruscus TaxID=42192 RepID=A0A6J8CL25_MYTCO|nr:unnamed protein product [Mytilus coruscus]